MKWRFKMRIYFLISIRYLRISAHGSLTPVSRMENCEKIWKKEKKKEKKNYFSLPDVSMQPHVSTRGNVYLSVFLSVGPSVCPSLSVRRFLLFIYEPTVPCDYHSSTFTHSKWFELLTKMYSGLLRNVRNVSFVYSGRSLLQEWRNNGWTDGRTGGGTDERMDGRMDRRMDGRLRTM